MRQYLLIAQLIVSILLIGLILVQARGTGFGRGMSMGGGSFSRRGLEKLIFRLTFIATAVFIGISVLSLVV